MQNLIHFDMKSYVRLTSVSFQRSAWFPFPSFPAEPGRGSAHGGKRTARHQGFLRFRPGLITLAFVSVCFTTDGFYEILAIQKKPINCERSITHGVFFRYLEPNLNAFFRLTRANFEAIPAKSCSL